MAGTVMFGKNSETGPSPGLWGLAPRDVFYDPAVASVIKEDFLDPIVTADRWTIVEGDAASAFSHLVTEIGGVARLQVATTDNHECYIGSGGETVWGKYDAGEGDMFWEVRFRTSSITDCAIYIGMAEESTAAANMLVDDTGAMVAKDTVGFHSLTATPSILSAVYNTASGTQVVAGTAQTMVADTWYKVGCYFNGSRNYWYVNGVAVAPTAGVLESAATFPDGEELGFAIGVKTGDALTVNLDVDWVYWAQLRK